MLVVLEFWGGSLAMQNLDSLQSCIGGGLTSRNEFGIIRWWMAVHIARESKPGIL